MIVTHTSPDLDAIGAVWLLKRYGGMVDHEVVYVNTGSPDPAVLASADAVVDTGRELDPLRLRFDHHHLPGAEANTCCATSLVYQWLRSENERMEPIAPLIDLIYAGDTGQKAYGADWSRIVGIHALLSALKARKATDAILMEHGCGWLDMLDEHLRARDEARRTLADHLVYTSGDGLVVALRDAPQGATFAAMEQGARLVVFANYQENAIGVMRGGEWQEPHVGGLVDLLIADSQVSADLIGETGTWFCHPAGFFAGRGTKKAPREDPILIDLADVARAIDRAWRR